MKGVFYWLVRWACRAGTGDFCSALAALISPVQNIFFSHGNTISIPLSTSETHTKRQAIQHGCLPFACWAMETKSKVRKKKYFVQSAGTTPL
jgi:hypothetical protein